MEDLHFQVSFKIWYCKIAQKFQASCKLHTILKFVVFDAVGLISQICIIDLYWIFLQRFDKYLQIRIENSGGQYMSSMWVWGLTWACLCQNVHWIATSQHNFIASFGASNAYPVKHTKNKIHQAWRSFQRIRLWLTWVAQILCREVTLYEVLLY